MINRNILTLATLLTAIQLSFAQANTNTYYPADAGNGNVGLYNSSFGYKAGDVVTGSENTFLGASSGPSVSSGARNLFAGYASGQATTTGSDNTFLGTAAGASNTTGTRNVFVGFGAGIGNTSGGYNVFLGGDAGRGNKNGTNNIFIGHAAGYHTTSGSSNTIIGDGSGTENTIGQNNVFLGRAAGAKATGSGNVFLGHYAGYDELGSNKLYIDNTSTSMPLIHGDFSTNQLGINAAASGTHTLTVGGTLNATAVYVNNQLIETLWSKSSSNIYFGTGNVGVGTNSPSDRFHISGGNIVFDNGNTPTLYTGVGTTELNRYLQLVNSSALQSSSGLKAGGVLVADTYGYANPSKNELIVKDRIGIGTPSPLANLHIEGNAVLNNEMPVLYTGSSSSELNRYLHLGNSPGTASASGLKAGGILIADTYAYASPGMNDLIVKGRIGIGTPLTANANGYHLAVNGKIGAHDLRIERTSNAWPDYVFDKEYKLPSLYEVEKYVKENGHLEEVPSASEVKKEGYSVDQMTETLLKKVEELTLYIIQQQKEIDALKKQLGEK